MMMTRMMMARTSDHEDEEEDEEDDDGDELDVMICLIRFRIKFDIIDLLINTAVVTNVISTCYFALGPPSSINISTYLWLTVRRTSPQKDRPTAYEPSRQEKAQRDQW